IAYTVVYGLSPGYIFTGYLKRYAPFHVFMINLLVSLALYTFARLSWHFLRIAYVYWPAEKIQIKQMLINPPMKRLWAVVSVGIFCLVVPQWFFVQYQYIRLLPPTVFNFVKLLKDPQLQGKTSVSNQYPLPYAFQLNNWAYNDASIASGKFELGQEGYFYPRD